jgi:hypothetical protein
MIDGGSVAEIWQHSARLFEGDRCVAIMCAEKFGCAVDHAADASNQRERCPSMRYFFVSSQYFFVRSAVVGGAFHRSTSSERAFARTLAPSRNSRKRHAKFVRSADNAARLLRRDLTPYCRILDR